MHKRFARYGMATLTLLHLTQGAVLAQDDPAPDMATEPSRLSVSLEGGASTLFEADLDGPDANVSLWRSEASATISFQARDDWHLSLELGTGFHAYDFGGDVGLGAGDLLSDARTHDVTFTAMHIIDETWSAIAGATIHASYEDGADFGDSLTYGGFGAVGYRANDRLSFQFGIAARSQLEDSALVLPYIGVQYQLSDQTALRSKGLGLELSMKINDQLTASIFGQYELEAFRLADDNPVLPAGVMEDRMIIVGASATWTPTSQFSLTGIVGAAVWRELEFRNDDGDDLGDIETDTSPMLALRASFDF